MARVGREHPFKTFTSGFDKAIYSLPKAYQSLIRQGLAYGEYVSLYRAKGSQIARPSRDMT